MTASRLSHIILKAVCTAFFYIGVTVPCAMGAETPDFAFPETAAHDAETRLNTALHEGNSVRALRAALDMCVARNIVSVTSVNANTALLDSLAGVLPAPYGNLAALAGADLLHQYYSGNRWMFDSRTAYDSVPPADIDAWSRDDFAARILRLVDRALPPGQLPSALTGTPLSQIECLLDNASSAIDAQCSVFDFMSRKGASLLRELGRVPSGNVIPFFPSHDLPAADIGARCYERSMQVVNTLYDWRREAGNIPALTLAVAFKADLLDWENRGPFLGDWAQRLVNNEWDAVLISEWKNYATLERTPLEARKLAEAARTWLADFKNSPWRKTVQYALSELERQSLALDINAQVLPERTFRANATVTNAPVSYVLLYRITGNTADSEFISAKELVKRGRQVACVRIDTDGTAPFQSRRTVAMPALPAGTYVAVPSLTPRLARNWTKQLDSQQLQVINVSGISTVESKMRDGSQPSLLIAVDAFTQKPLPGAKVSLYDRDKSRQPLHTLTTDPAGTVTLPEGTFHAKASWHGNDAWQWIYRNSSRPYTPSGYGVSILTDLPVYKPGQNIGFVMTLWNTRDNAAKLCPDTDVLAVLLDHERNRIDTVGLRTDRMGRCNGEFPLDRAAKPGQYWIEVLRPGENRRVGMSAVQVAQYKAPRFMVTSQAGLNASADSVTISGEVVTFTGLPVAGARISCTVDWMPWWRPARSGRIPGSASFATQCTAGPDGHYSISLPLDSIKGTFYADGIFSAAVTAASLSGESQSAPAARFTVGEAYTVTPEFPNQIEVTGSRLTLDVPVRDMLNRPAVKRVEYTMTACDGDFKFNGSFTSPSLVLDPTAIPSGRYRMQFNIAGDTLRTDADLVLWRTADNVPPYPTPLWTPAREIVCEPGADSVAVHFGTSYPSSWILCQTACSDGSVSRQWLQVDGTMTSVAVPAPAPGTRCWVTLRGMHDLEAAEETVCIIPADQARQLKVSAESVRDVLSAGSREQWRFRFSIDGQPAAGVAAMAVMTDKALNAIMPFEWNLNLGSVYWNLPASLTYSSGMRIFQSARFGTLPRYDGFVLRSTGWNTYGYPLAGAGMRIRGMKRSAGADGVYNAPAMVEEMKMEMATSVTSNGAMVMETADADTAPAAGMAPDAGSAELPKPRPVELPLAFFKPALTADARGDVTVEFETPDFNTTWLFQLVGYDSDMKTARFTTEAVASKPVMVVSNMPRVLRTGDLAYVSATLYNNSGSVADVSGLFKVTDPDSGDVLVDFETVPHRLAPSGSVTEWASFKVPQGCARLEISAYAKGESSADGERAVVPVLPAVAPVVEATPYYIDGDSTSVSIRLPRFGRDESVTLRWCDNPLRECLLALPGISNPEGRTVTDIARALYANTTVLAILQANPWLAAEPEMEPWRDKEAVNGTLDALLASLQSLQNEDGGWSWCPGMRSSYWMTASALAILAEGQNLCGVPKPAVEKAARYCDRHLLDAYLNNDRTFDTAESMRWLHTRSLLGVKAPSGKFTAYAAEVLKAVIDGWERFGIADKAVAAMMLHNDKTYSRMAPVILESLRQTAMKSPELGWWFDNLTRTDGLPGTLGTTALVLKAFTAIQPGTGAVRGLRQWLLLEKETQDWKTDNSTVAVTAAILAGNPPSAQGRTAPAFAIDGIALQMPDSVSGTGTLSIPLDPRTASGKTLTVTRQAGLPAWGGVIASKQVSVRKVKAFTSPHLKVEKRIDVIAGDVTAPKPSGAAPKVGDRVRVTLTLQCGKAMDYVVLSDQRPACLEPTVQLSGYTMADGLGAYRSITDAGVTWYMDRLPVGTFVITYDCTVSRPGDYSRGFADVHSEYSPLQTAHTAGGEIKVK